MNTFFICALPRSRTAWLANFLSYGPAHCFHEPLGSHDLEELPEVFRATGRQYVGTSDSVNTLLVDHLLKIFPLAKLVVVRRPWAEVGNSLVHLGFPTSWELLRKMDKALDEIESKHKPLVIDYYNFDAQEIWNYILPDVPFNRERTEMLETFNITVPKSVSEAKGEQFLARTKNVEALIGKR